MSSINRNQIHLLVRETKLSISNQKDKLVVFNFIGEQFRNNLRFNFQNLSLNIVNDRQQVDDTMINLWIKI